MSDPPNVETRLEAMERRLAEIQRELAPEFPVRPVPDPAPRPAPPAGAAEAPDPAPPADTAEAPAAPPAPVVEVSAGPFPSMDALREFEQAVAELPGVGAVAIRGYESGNRAILEVQLRPDTS